MISTISFIRLLFNKIVCTQNLYIALRHTNLFRVRSLSAQCRRMNSGREAAGQKLTRRDSDLGEKLLETSVSVAKTGSQCRFEAGRPSLPSLGPPTPASKRLSLGATYRLPDRWRPFATFLRRGNEDQYECVAHCILTRLINYIDAIRWRDWLCRWTNHSCVCALGSALGHWHHLFRVFLVRITSRTSHIGDSVLSCRLFFNSSRFRCSFSQRV